jgi:hypothetical protein
MSQIKSYNNAKSNEIFHFFIENYKNYLKNVIQAFK